MTFDEFKSSVTDAEESPPDVARTLVALWHDARGNWHKAHETVQSQSGEDAAWVHAYLHRKEGDLSNAGYWYRRAGKAPSRATLDDEWESIARALSDG